MAADDSKTLTERMFGAGEVDDEGVPATRQSSEATVNRALATGPAAGGFSVGAGIGFAMRSFEQVGADRTTSYDGGAYPELTLSADLYPGVWLTRSFWRNLGLGLAYSRHLSISSSEALGGGQDGSGRDVGSSSQQLTLDLKLRWPILVGDWSPLVVGRVGWGFRAFELDPNDVLTSFNYQFLRFGVDMVAPLGTPLVALNLGADLRPLLAIGQEAVNAYGSRDGGLAWSLRAGLSGRLAFGLTYFVTFEYLSFGADFSGRSDLAPEQLLAVDRADASSVSDSFLRFWTGVGYAL